MRMLPVPSLAFTMAAGLAALPGTGMAAGFQLAEQNASGLGSVFAGQAALADDASVIYFNPAGLTRLDSKLQFSIAGHYVRPSSTFDNTGSCAPYAGTGVGTTSCPFGAGGNLGHAAGGDGGSVSKAGFVPNLYAAWQIGDLRLGLGVNAPFGLETKRDPTWVGRFRAIDSETTAININPTAAWKLGPVSVGAGLDAQRFTATLSNAVSYRAVALASGSAALVSAVPPGTEGVATVKGNDWGYGWNVGADWAPAPELHLGLSYRSAIRYTLSGNASFTNRPAALASVPNVADGAVTAAVKLPDLLSLAAAWQPGAVKGLTLLADWTRTGWDSVQDLTVVRADGPLSGQTLTSTPLRFKNSWRAGLGAAWAVNPAWTLRAGYVHETSPVVDMYRSPRLPDSDRNWYGIGARWKFSADTSVDAGFALVRPKNAPSALANQDAATSPPAGSLVGTYSSTARILGVQLNQAF